MPGLVSPTSSRSGSLARGLYGRSLTTLYFPLPKRMGIRCTWSASKIASGQAIGRESLKETRATPQLAWAAETLEEFAARGAATDSRTAGWAWREQIGADSTT